MRYGAYHVWMCVKGLTEEERRAVLVILEQEKAELPWDWDFNLEPDGSIWIAPLIKGDNPDVMDRQAVREVRSLLPRRRVGQTEPELYVDRFERVRR